MLLKWGGGAFIIYQSTIPSPFQMVGFYGSGDSENYYGITRYEVDMKYINTLLDVRLIERNEYEYGHVKEEPKFNPVDNTLSLWVPGHVVTAWPEVPTLEVIVNDEIVKNYNGISMKNIGSHQYFDEYSDKDPLILTIDPNLVEDDRIILEFTIHGWD